MDPSNVLMLLRQLPDAFPRAPRIWVPRSLKQQIASILRGLIVDATQCASAHAGDLEAESKHRLCRAAAQLLLRAPAESGAAAQQEHPDDQLRSTAEGNQVLRERARMALRGEWGPLVERLLADLQSVRQAGQARGTRPPSSRGPDGKLTAAAAQAATLKARCGSKRGAADILLGGPRVPPGPDADRGVRGLFQCEPLAESSKASAGIGSSRSGSKEASAGYHSEACWPPGWKDQASSRMWTERMAEQSHPVRLHRPGRTPVLGSVELRLEPRQHQPVGRVLMDWVVGAAVLQNCCVRFREAGSSRRGPAEVRHGRLCAWSRCPDRQCCWGKAVWCGKARQSSCRGRRDTCSSRCLS